MLDGFTVGVTADRRADEEIELLIRAGADVLHGPSIRTLPLSHDDDLRQVTQTIVEDPPDLVVATSGLAVRAWCSAADVWGVGDALLLALGASRLVGNNDAAETAMREAGLRPLIRPPGFGPRVVAELLATNTLDGRRVAVVLGDGRVDPAIAALADHGVSILTVPVGSWTLPLDIRPAVRLIEAAIGGSIQAVTFTSAPAIRNLFLIAEEHGRASALRQALDGPVVSVCVGPVCLSAAQRRGLRHVRMPAKFRLRPMVEELASALDQRVRRFRVAGHSIVIRGTVVELDAQRIELAEREAGLLRALCANPGVALSKRELLHEVWGDRLKDDHVVEVTVARLRRRLGDCAEAIVAVPRRGYRFDAVVAA